MPNRAKPEHKGGRGDGADGDRPIAELAALREVEPPTALVAKVMTRVAEPAPRSWWQWLRRPHRIEVRVSPLGASILGASLVAAAALVARRPPAPAIEVALAPSPRGGEINAGTGSPAAAPQSVLVRFVFEARGAKQVSLVGTFNDWSVDALKLENVDRDGLFVATVPLPRGFHEYMFVVDGEWTPDPLTSDRRPDGFGRQNSLLRL